MFLIVNINPAIDRIYTIDNFSIDKIHRTSNVLFQAGGKGINVARANKVLKGEALLTGICGGHSSGFISEDLKHAGILNDFSISDFESRTCLIIIDKVNNTQTVINEDGPPLSDSCINSFIDKFKNLVKDKNLVVISGSLPKSLSRNIYNELVLIAKENNTKTIIDTSKKALNEVLKIKPFMIKPNIYEFSEIFNDDNISSEALNENFKPLVVAADKLIDAGIENIVVSLGDLGAIFINKDKIFRVEAPNIKAINAIASGDAMTAAIALELSKNKIIEEAVISGVAAGSANATVGGLRFSYDLFLQLRCSIKSFYLERNELN
ncbi:MAG: 1-phosphofructokinase family hexose kinase [Cyanobacteriota bacterium]